ncbi:FAD-dependent oxidoreductase [Amycolatopsis sp. CA-126428]|uniref:FAD-dependent oxidoreductase n=1 Tax=Amycolatopsis sp. CA-126428 TaxID=2073158 RepID=UPI001E413E64|nr:FAD-dependent oxidoreductase [Amycolatopsis sp. CA-126428]
MPARDTDVVVVGGGAMGSAAAWQLAARGVGVLLLERFATGHTRGTSHGASRIFRLAYPDSGYIGLARQAEALWRELEDVSRTDLLTITGGVSHGRTPDIGRVATALEAAGPARRTALARRSRRTLARAAVRRRDPAPAPHRAAARRQRGVGVAGHRDHDVSVHTIERAPTALAPLSWRPGPGPRRSSTGSSPCPRCG